MADRAATFVLHTLGDATPPQGAVARTKQRLSAQAERIERQKQTLERRGKLIETLRRRVAAQKKEIEGLAHALYARPRASEAPTPAAQGSGDFARNGFIGPVRVFAAEQCRLIAEHIRDGSAAPAGSPKGRAAADRFWYELGAHPTLISHLRTLIGDDIVIWGSELVTRDPGQPHPWHTDIESSDPDGGFVSVWIGLENTSQQSGLQLIAGSHAFGKPIQQVCHEKGVPRGGASPENVLAWAQEIDSEAQLTQPVVSDGEALIFDGRLWHGSYNALDKARTALLLQYAKADKKVRLRDPKQVEWPFRFLETPLPPVIVVSGEGNEDVNRVAPPPASSDETGAILGVNLGSGTHALPLPLKHGKDWRSHSVFRGTTPILEFFGCHVSVLSPDHSPHPPHAHADEELLIVLDGEAELVISDSTEVEGADIESVREGNFIYYPPYQHHTIRNAGKSPVTYLMFKWRGIFSGMRETGRQIFHCDFTLDAVRPRWHRSLFAFETPYLGKLASHVTVLQPGASYEPHIDPYDVAILLLAGTVETVGGRVSAPGVIYYRTGEPHGIENVGEGPAHYLVFEFHPDTREPARLSAPEHPAYV